MRIFEIMSFLNECGKAKQQNDYIFWLHKHLNREQLKATWVREANKFLLICVKS